MEAGDGEADCICAHPAALAGRHQDLPRTLALRFIVLTVSARSRERFGAEQMGRCCSRHRIFYSFRYLSTNHVGQDDVLRVEPLWLPSYKEENSLAAQVA